MAEPEAPASEREALAAVGRVLAAATSAEFVLQPVLDRVLTEAAAVCHAEIGFAFLLEGGVFRTAAGVGATPEHWDFQFAHELSSGRV